MNFLLSHVLSRTHKLFEIARREGGDPALTQDFVVVPMCELYALVEEVERLHVLEAAMTTTGCSLGIAGVIVIDMAGSGPEDGIA